MDRNKTHMRLVSAITGCTAIVTVFLVWSFWGHFLGSSFGHFWGHFLDHFLVTFWTTFGCHFGADGPGVIFTAGLGVIFTAGLI